MPNFSYKIVDKNNKIISGSIKALFKIKARKQLEKDGATVLFIIPGNRREFSLKSLFFLRRFSANERIIFFRNLGAMVASGISAADALRVISGQTQNKQAKKVITAMIKDIENGQKLSMTMRNAPRGYFSEFLIESINVGEITGLLTDTLERIADDLQYEYDLKRKVLASLSYPTIVIFVMIVVMVVMMVYVLPQIAVLFQELNTALPLPTKILLKISEFFQKYYFLVIGIIVLLIVAAIFLKKIKKVRYFLHYTLLKLPIFGKMIRETNIALFFRSLEALFIGGVPLLRSIEVSGKTLKNNVYQDALIAMNPILMHGTNLSEAFRPYPFLFPPQLQRIVEVGEKTGKLEESFKRLNYYYDRSVRHRTEILASTIEPIILLLAGVSVGAIALSIFLPIYQSVQVL